MKAGVILSLIIIFILTSCNTADQGQYISILHPGHEDMPVFCDFPGKALLTTAFTSLSSFQSLVNIQYYKKGKPIDDKNTVPDMVLLSYVNSGIEITSNLSEGITEFDIMQANEGDHVMRMYIAWRVPEIVRERNNLEKAILLLRRRPQVFGEGDPAFYDLAEATMHQIDRVSSEEIDQRHFSEKGFINTFNHIYAQALIATLFSVEIADFVSDAHERFRIPELITGNFSVEQMEDLEEGPLDNYIDLINNKIGQDIGRSLSLKYSVDSGTHWTPELLAWYLNAIVDYFSWSFSINISHFHPSDEVVQKFVYKINRLLHEDIKFE